MFNSWNDLVKYVYSRCSEANILFPPFIVLHKTFLCYAYSDSEYHSPTCLLQTSSGATLFIYSLQRCWTRGQPLYSQRALVCFGSACLNPPCIFTKSTAICKLQSSASHTPELHKRPSHFQTWDLDYKHFPSNLFTALRGFSHMSKMGNHRSELKWWYYAFCQLYSSINADNICMFFLP